MKTKLFILMLLLGASHHSNSQITFQTTLNRDGGGNGFAVQPTSDGGYIWVGYTADAIVTGSNIFLIKTNAIGDTLWTRYYGGPLQDWGWSLQQTTDDGFIITGWTMSFGAGGEDVYLLKVDSLGDLIWSRTFGGSNNDRGNCVRQTTDGGYIVAGFTESYGLGSSNIFLVKTDANGDSLWTKILGGSVADLASSIQQTPDGGYILTGVTNSFGTGNGDVYLIKTDQHGDPLWQKAYGEGGYDFGYSVQQTTDGGYILTGYSSSFGAGDEDCYLVKTDSAGDLIWSKNFGGIGSDRARCVQQTTDGGFVIAGFSYSFSAGDGDAYLIKTDALGNISWSHRFGGESEDQVRSVCQTADGGYVVTGGSLSFGTGTYDIYLIKTDTNGSAICMLDEPQTIENTSATLVVSFSSTITASSPVVTSPATNSASGADVIVACTVGLNELNAENSFQVFPNPASGNVTLSFNEILSNVSIEIINVFGEIELTKDLSGKPEMNINLEHLNSGVHFVRIFDGQNTYCKKIIVE